MKGCFTFPLSGGCFSDGGIHFKVGGGEGGAPWGGISFDGRGEF